MRGGKVYSMRWLFDVLPANFRRRLASFEMCIRDRHRAIELAVTPSSLRRACGPRAARGPRVRTTEGRRDARRRLEGRLEGTAHRGGADTAESCGAFGAHEVCRRRRDGDRVAGRVHRKGKEPADPAAG